MADLDEAIKSIKSNDALAVGAEENNVPIVDVQDEVNNLIAEIVQEIGMMLRENVVNEYLDIQKNKICTISQFNKYVKEALLDTENGIDAKQIKTIKLLLETIDKAEASLDATLRKSLTLTKGAESKEKSSFSLPYTE